MFIIAFNNGNLCRLDDSNCLSAAGPFHPVATFATRADAEEAIRRTSEIPRRAPAMAGAKLIELVLPTPRPCTNCDGVGTKVHSGPEAKLLGFDSVKIVCEHCFGKGMRPTWADMAIPEP